MDRPLLYLSHSTACEYRREFYEPLRASALGDSWRLWLPHEHEREGAPARELIRLQAALILAEVSFAATGQGIELGWADAFGVPVLALHRLGSSPSRSLRFIGCTPTPYQPGRFAECASELVADWRAAPRS